MSVAAPLSVRRAYNLDALAAMGAQAPNDSLALAAQNRQLQSVTVDNFSNCVVAVFFDRPAYASSPLGASSIVPAQFMKTLPCNAASVGFVVIPPKGDIMRGSVYLEATTEKLAAAGGASPNPILGTMTWDYSTWDSGATWAV